MEPRDPTPAATPPGARNPLDLLEESCRRGDFDILPRRSFLAIGGALGAAVAMTACGSTQRMARMPAPAWTDSAESPRRAVASNAAPASTGGASKPPPAGEMNPIGEAALPWARPRFLWAKGPPDTAELNPMLPVTAITVHHDGLEPVLYATDAPTMAARIEHYRVGHRGRGWADIGYHLVIDRAGTLWQGRAIRWQGAHVKNRNEGNIGVLVMGNFELQHPTEAQMRTLQRALADLMRTYKVPRSRVYTHREWPDADTLCPGKHLQAKVGPLRRTLA